MDQNQLKMGAGADPPPLRVDIICEQPLMPLCIGKKKKKNGMVCIKQSDKIFFPLHSVKGFLLFDLFKGEEEEEKTITLFNSIFLLLLFFF